MASVGIANEALVGHLQLFTAPYRGQTSIHAIAHEALLSNESSTWEEDVGREKSGSRTAEWWYTSIVIVASIVGIGVLAVPGSVKNVGWVGMAIIVCCYPTNLYTGLLIAKLAMFFPHAKTFGDVAGKVWGDHGRHMTYFVLYVYLFLLLGDFLLVAAKSVQGFFYDVKICLPTAALLSCLWLLPSNQFRTLSNLTVLGAVSTLTITAVLGICLKEAIFPASGESCEKHVNLKAAGGSSHAHLSPTYTGISFLHTFLNINGSISTMIFAFSGQKIFLEMVSEMKNPAEFPKACHVAFPYLLIIYLLIAGLTYGYCGEATPDYLMDIVPYGTLRRITNLLMFIHIGISYTITQQVLSGALHRRFFPDNLHNMLDFSLGMRHLLQQDRAWRSQFQWFLISSGLLFLSFMLSSAVPFFEGLVQLMGALLSSVLSFALPVGLHYYAISGKGGALSTFDRVCALVLGVLTVYIMITGTVGALIHINNSWATYGAPFSCQCGAIQAVCET